MAKCYQNIRKKASFLAVILSLLLIAAPVYSQTPADPKYPFQLVPYEQIHAPEAWNYATGSPSVVVALIDTGVDINNVDLVGNIWTNKKEIAGNNKDDDNNGYKDDVNGWNFVEKNNDVGISKIQEVDDSQAVDHGTVLAGIIGAIGGNNYSGTGLNWRVKIMPLRAVDSSGSGSLAEVAQAVDYAVKNGASIISLSLVGESNDLALSSALRNAYKRGVLIVAAAGNSRFINEEEGDLAKIRRYPVCEDASSTENWILGVTSVDSNDRVSSFANVGSCVDIAAPGENIYSTQRYAPEYGFMKDFDGGWFGTSFSVPFVVGAAALVKSVRPDWQAKQILHNLLSTADDLDYKNPSYAGRLGYGRLNVYRAVKAAVESRKNIRK